jgi:hypothetical protein
LKEDINFRPRLSVPWFPGFWPEHEQSADLFWTEVPALPPFFLADGSGLARQQTVARVCYDLMALYVRFDCADRDIWGTYTQRDDPIYDQEVVELFLAAGEVDPVHYYEFEVSPNGVLFDALVFNPTSERRDMVVDTTWNCEGIRWQAGRGDRDQHWWADLAIPWKAIKPPGDLPSIWRANFYRIERPRDAAPEFSCWSPTLTEPADFHRPAHFGSLVLADMKGEHQ